MTRLGRAATAPRSVPEQQEADGVRTADVWCPCFVPDELRHISHAEDPTNVLYRVVNDRQLKRRLVLITRNKPLAPLR